MGFCWTRCADWKPTDEVSIKAFNSKLWAECLNGHWFMSLADAREKLEDWCRYYNEDRPQGHDVWSHLTVIVKEPDKSCFQWSKLGEQHIVGTDSPDGWREVGSQVIGCTAALALVVSHATCLLVSPFPNDYRPDLAGRTDFSLAAKAKW